MLLYMYAYCIYACICVRFMHIFMCIYVHIEAVSVYRCVLYTPIRVCTFTRLYYLYKSIYT